MSKIRFLKGYLENGKVQKILKSKGLRSAVCAVAISAMAITFVSSKLTNNANASEEKRNYPPTQFAVADEKPKADLSNYNPQETINKGKGNVNGGVMEVPNVTLPDTGKEEDNNFTPVIPVPNPEVKPEQKPDVKPEEKPDVKPEEKPEEGYTEDGYLDSSTEEHKALTVKRLEELAIADNYRIETEIAETADMIIELGRVRVPAHEVNGAKFEWEALKQFVPEQIKDIIISVEEPSTVTFRSNDVVYVDIVVSVHEVRYDLNGDGYEDNRYLDKEADLGAHFDLVKERVENAIVERGFKLGTTGEYSIPIRVPMHEYNGLKDIELDAVEEILTKHKAQDFKIDVHRRGDSGEGNMWIIVYFNPDQTDANGDGYIDSLLLDKHTDAELIYIESDYEVWLRNNGFSIAENSEFVELGKVDFPAHISNGKLDFETEKLKSELERLGLKEADIKVTQTPGVNGEAGTVHVSILGAKPEQTIPGSVINEAPVINSKDEVFVKIYSDFDINALEISATDKEDGTVPYEIVSENVDTSKTGDYYVTVKATDKNGASTTKTITVYVRGKGIPAEGLNKAPVIEGSDYQLVEGEAFDWTMIGFVANDTEDGKVDVTLVESTVNPNQAGTYYVTVQAVDKDGATTKKTVTVTVKEAPNSAPVITGDNITLEQGASFDVSMLNIKVTDAEDVTVENVQIDASAVNTEIPGVHNVVVTATDSKGLQATATFTVTVTKKQTSPQELAMAVEQSVFRMVNDERAKLGLAPLTWSDTNVKYAREKSTDMFVNNYFDHADLNGKYSYEYMREDGIVFYAWAENIARSNATAESNADDIAASLMNLWMNSEGHKANILSPDSNTLSVGVHIENGRVLATQIFTLQ